MKKKVYIAGPITKGDLAHNVNQATAAFVALAKAGFAPLCPHWSVYSSPCSPRMKFKYEEGSSDPYKWAPNEEQCVCIGTRNGNDDMTHADWLALDLPWIACADAVLRLPGESTGADLEVGHAIECGVPVYFSLEALIERFAEKGAA